MELIDKAKEAPGRRVEQLTESLVARDAARPALLQHGLRDHDVGEHRLLQHVHLVQHDVGVGHQVVREREARAERARRRLQAAPRQAAGLVAARLRPAAQVVAQVVLAHDLQDVAATRLFGENAVEHSLFCG